MAWKHNVPKNGSLLEYVWRFYKARQIKVNTTVIAQSQQRTVLTVDITQSDDMGRNRDPGVGGEYENYFFFPEKNKTKKALTRVKFNTSFIWDRW